MKLKLFLFRVLSAESSLMNILGASLPIEVVKIIKKLCIKSNVIPLRGRSVNA